MRLKKVSCIIFLLFIVKNITAQDISKYLNQLDSVQGNAKVDVLNKITWKLRNSNPRGAIKYSQRAIILSDSLNYFKGTAMGHNFMGVLYRNLGLYNLALMEYQKAIAIAENKNIKDQLGYGYNNYGNLYLYQELPDLAIKYLKKVIPIAKEIENKDLEAYALQNMGRSYLLLHKTDSAKNLILSAIKIRTDKKLKEKLGVSYKYLGDCYLAEKNYTKANEAYLKTTQLTNFQKDVDLYADYCLQKSKIFVINNKIDSAIYYATQSLETAKEIKSSLRIKNAYEGLSKLRAKQKDYINAYLMEQNVGYYKDSLYNEQVSKRIQSVEFSSEQRQKQSQIILIKKDLLLKKANNKRNRILLAFSALLILIILIAFIWYYKSREKISKINQTLVSKNKLITEKNNQLKEKSFELSVQSQNLKQLNEELEQQKKILIEQQKETTDSIQYASRIQNALMPYEGLFKTLFKEYCILNKPRNIVSGDFYWLKHSKDFIYLAVADCTGHGVSGAFMSVLGISILNEVINRNIDRDLNPATGEILDQLREKLKFVLRQTNIKDNKDGLDISLVKINRSENLIEFSGAYNNAYLIDNNELKIMEADSMPVAIYRKEKPFNTQTISFNSTAKLYLSTDGYQDQTGGERGRKYFTKNFRELLLKTSGLSLYEQKLKLEHEFITWKGNYKQIDDVLIVGIQI